MKSTDQEDNLANEWFKLAITTLEEQSRVPTPTKFLYETPNPMAFLTKIPDSKPRFQNGMRKYPEIYHPNRNLNVLSVDIRKFPVFEAQDSRFQASCTRFQLVSYP